MDSQRGIVEDSKPQSLTRQGSVYSLTLNEVQTHLGTCGKPLESMNLDELLKSVCSVEANHPPPPSVDVKGSLTLPRGLSKKTVEEVWKDIQQDKNGGSGHGERTRLGEMTLEDLLLKAGVVTETVPGGGGGGSGAGLGQDMTQVGSWVQYHQLPAMTQAQPFMTYPVADMQAMVSQSSLMGGLSDTQTPGRKRVASGEVVEKIVERKQKRMIKNRESAARSRARKQAYTHELEIKVSRLEEENERLRRQKEVEKILPSAPPPDPKRQLRRTSSAPF